MTCSFIKPVNRKTFLFLGLRKRTVEKKKKTALARFRKNRSCFPLNLARIETIEEKTGQPAGPSPD